jgi:5-methylcytosine-specific restriction endonuclease McrA
MPPTSVGWWRRLGRLLRRDRAARRNRSQGSHCFYCGAPFSGEGSLARTVDHRVPRGSGGHDGLANLVFACRACNQRKKDLPEQDFVASDWLLRRRADLGVPGGEAGGGDRDVSSG